MEIKNLEPQAVWSIFDKITSIPRPSKKEGKILQYLEEFAKSHSLNYKKDKIGNIVICKPATHGKELSPKVILQSHVDMVCEKNSDTVFDFENDPIKTYIDNGWVRARGTTLGADCGIGMAAQLALLASVDLPHPALEALFTVDEETGLTGAFNLGEDMLKGKYLINLDSEDEGEIFIGCAGGIDTIATFKYTKESLPEGFLCYKASVKGLTGGHSGDDIDKGYGNSNKIINRFLRKISLDYGARLSHFDGGNLRNAIPREATCVFSIEPKWDEIVKKYFEIFSSEIKHEFKNTENKIIFSLESASANYVIDYVTQSKLINSIQGLPNGVLSMSHSMEGLVETSSNLASVKFIDSTVIVTTSQRSSIDSAKLDAMSSIESVFLLAGADVAHSDGYPGWSPEPNSKLLEIVKKSYETLFDKQPKVRAIHAGLECGLFLKKYPQLEMISFGPTLRGVHSPDERLEIATVSKFWDLLVECMKVI